MAEDNYSFAQTKTRLEDIVAQVRKKDVSLEKSLDLLEEGVRLANRCTELIDHADWEAGELAVSSGAGVSHDDGPADEPSGEGATEGEIVSEHAETAASETQDSAEPRAGLERDAD